MKPADIRAFFKLESASGIVLFVAALLAMMIANSPIAHWLESLLNHPLYTTLPKITPRFVINDGLMTLFFLLVGLELKRAWAEGELSPEKIILPGAGAISGMVFPAIIYIAFTHADPIAWRGWAIPSATDIAFSLGVLSLFGKRIPASLKFFLMLLAIFDDTGAVLIIALFYSHGIAWTWFTSSLLILLTLAFMARQNVCSISIWLFAGILLCFSLGFTGIHPVLGGALLAAMLPASGKNNLVARLEKKIHPWVAWGVMPLFALANAGVSLQGCLTPSHASIIVPAIIKGLFIGKPFGIIGISWLLIRYRITTLPTNTNWKLFCGTAFLCGIGFTMSLFIGILAFANEAPVYTESVRLGVLIGSIISGITGAILIYYGLKKS